VYGISFTSGVITRWGIIMTHPTAIENQFQIFIFPFPDANLVKETVWLKAGIAKYNKDIRILEKSLRLHL